MNTLKYNLAVDMRWDHWVPACGGTEEPFRARSGATLQYCFNPARQQHAYLLLSGNQRRRTDIVLTQEQAEAHLQMMGGVPCR